MHKKFYNIFYFSLLIVLLLAPGRAEAYGVSGVVAFTYTADEMRTGAMKTSSYSFAQDYHLALQNYIWDPRFLRLQAGIGYTKVSSSSSENKGLNYDLSLNFFPGMMISWELYDRQATSKVFTNANIAGYDLTSSSYGGSLNIQLSRQGARGSNNNNNNNNNSNNNNYNNNYTRNRFHFPLPDIYLTYGHVDSDAPSSLNLIKESRDNAGLSMNYRISPGVDLTLSQSAEIYKNFITGGTYDSKSTSFASKVAVSPEADLEVSGSRTDRTTAGLVGFGLTNTAWVSTAALNYKERNGITHGYTYGYSKFQSDYSDLTSHNASATVAYQIDRDLSLHGGLNYTLAEYISRATITASEQKLDMKSGGAQTGVTYRRIYTPDFLGPFAMNTDYGFNTGFTKITSAQTGTSGLYYENTAAIGFTSKGWQNDNIFIGYNISSRRDRALENNNRQQRFNIDASTTRVPQANIHASVSYSVIKSSANQFDVFTNNAQNNLSIGTRSLFYQVNASYAATPSLNFDAGASQGRTSNSTPSLSTLQPNTSMPVEQMAYIGGHYVTSITRNVTYLANVRDEYRSSFRSRTEVRNFDMGLDYRIRQILMNFTYRWNELMPENGLNSFQQSYFVKLSRPF